MQTYNKQSLADVVNLSLPKKHLELTEKQLERLKTTSEIILGIGFVIGVVALSVVAPNIVRILGGFSKGRGNSRTKEYRQKQNKSIIKSLYYLKQRGDIELIPDKNDFILKITQKGRKKMRRLRFETVEIAKSPNWNKHWWLVLADIPSKPYKGRADLFRNKLKQIGFYLLQRTVWVYPFDPRDEVDFVSEYYNLSKFVTVMEVLNLDPADEKVLNEFFKTKEVL